jgi:hypothetical protein
LSARGTSRRSRHYNIVAVVQGKAAAHRTLRNRRK